MNTIIITIIYILLIIGLIYSNKLSSNSLDIIFSMVFFGFAFWSFFLYQDSVDDGLRELGSIIYLMTISIIILLILVVIAVIQKRWFLTAPIIFIGLIWLAETLLYNYKKSNNITYQNFATKFPQIIDAVDNGNTTKFNDIILKNKENFENIPNILYWHIRPDNPKRLELIKVLVNNGYVRSNDFVFVIENCYKQQRPPLSNEELLMLDITTLLFEKRNLTQIYNVLNTLDYKYQSKYVDYFIKRLNIYNQGSSNPLYLYDKFQRQGLIFNNGIENIALFNQEQKQNYFALLRILVEKNQYFFSPESFITFLKNFNESVKRNLWDITKEDLQIIKEILNQGVVDYKPL